MRSLRHHSATQLHSQLQLNYSQISFKHTTEISSNLTYDSGESLIKQKKKKQ